MTSTDRPHDSQPDGDAKDMRDYRTIYQNAASPGHQTYISDIFDQNKQ